jgi:hypothetical protein
LYFWLDPKVPKDQDWIKISGFLRGGLFMRYKPLQRTGLRLLLYRLLKACATILPLKTGEIFIRPHSAPHTNSVKESQSCDMLIYDSDFVIA